MMALAVTLDEEGSEIQIVVAVQLLGCELVLCVAVETCLACGWQAGLIHGCVGVTGLCLPGCCSMWRSLVTWHLFKTAMQSLGWP